jgi:hypothetical protein
MRARTIAAVVAAAFLAFAAPAMADSIAYRPAATNRRRPRRLVVTAARTGTTARSCCRTRTRRARTPTGT